MILKKDLFISFVLGLLIFVFFLPLDANIHVFVKAGVGQWRLFIGIIFPFLTAFGYFVLWTIGKKIPVFLQVAKYGLVGVFNTVASLGIINILIFWTGVAAGYTADLFSAVAFVLVVTNSFFWNKYWTFGDTEKEKTVQEYIQFFAVSLSGALINVGVFHFIVNIIGPKGGIDPKVWANIAVAVGIPISFVWNFFGYKFIVFKKTILQSN